MGLQLTPRMRLGAGFCLSIAALAGFLYVFDARAMVDALRGATLVPALAGFGAVFLAVACWAESMRRVLVASGGYLSAREGFLAYCTGMLAKQIVPMGNAGGVPIMAYAIDREAGVGFNRSMAVVTIGDFLGLLSTLVLAVVGVGYVIVFVPGTRLLRAALVGVAVFAGVLLAVAVLLLYRRRLLRYLVLGVSRFLRGVLGRVSRRIEVKLAPESVAASVDRYFETFDTVRADRRSLLVATGLALVGRLLFAVPLYTSALAVGRPIPFGLVLFIFPVGAIATLFPLPGGLGGVEFAVAGMIVAMTGTEIAVAGALAFLYRLCVYWFLIVLGLLGVVYTGTSVRSLAASEDRVPDPGADSDPRP